MPTDTHEIDGIVRAAVAASTGLLDGDALTQRLLEAQRSTARPAIERRRLRRWQPLASIAALAIVAFAVVALSPWSNSDSDPAGQTGRSNAPGLLVPLPGRGSVTLPKAVIPAVGTASAKEVLTKTAANVTDGGSGPWRYIRQSLWLYSADFGYSVACTGTKCVYYRGDDTHQEHPIPKPEVHLRSSMIDERWSNGTEWLGRRQYDYAPTVGRCDGDPDPKPACLGNISLWVKASAPRSFPVGIAAGTAELERLATRRDTAVQAHGFGRSATLSPVQVGIWLLTEPAYDAVDRARIIRVLAAWPNTQNFGPRIDSLGRAGVEVAIPAYAKRIDGSPGAVPTSRFIAIFDVRRGQLLQYSQDAAPGWDEPGRPTGYLVIDEQSRQESPAATGKVQAHDNPSRR
ncbi:MAG: hypothetical protein H7287_11685 [Thermoleophilia bacterium]|nr:hypothetical protein [Thermoleophilia bacterium]